MIIIKNGRILNPATGLDEVADLIVEGERVKEIGKNIAENYKKNDADSCGNNDKNDDETIIIDAKGLNVMPGIVDLHVHFRDPGQTYKETLATGAKAAVRGGVTTVCPMPNTKPAVDNPELVKELVQRAKDETDINLLFIGAATKGQIGNETTDVKGMKREGIVAISEDGKSVMNSLECRKAMKAAKEEDIVVMAHCEDINLVDGGTMNAGKKAEELGQRGITNAVEDIIAVRDMLLSKETGARLHLCHVSTEDSVKMLKIAKEDGIEVTAECCPHHFTLCDEDIPCNDANYKMNPPLRSRKDMEALRKGLKEGVLDCISTDHAPHSAEEKSGGFENSPFGIVGLETSLALSYTTLVKGGYLTPLELAEKMSYNPAKVIKFDRGNIDVGKIADITVYDPEEKFVINTDEFASMGRNTPFNGKEVYGKVKYTICGGKILYKSGGNYND